MSDPVARLNVALEGRYRIGRELGEGGMATVYLATDLRHERQVALKVLKPELAAVVGAERFLAEIKTTANLHHPHVLPLHDSGEADGFLFYVMPFVEGETLRDRIAREKQLPVDEAVRLAMAVANALQHAHDRGVIHRDIKPANILIQDGQPVVSDFGIALAVGAAGGARLTETGLSVGTPWYMSPEQATGDQHIGPASDVYALAAVLYETLVGDPPHTGSTAQAVLGKIIQGDPVSASAIRRSVPANVDAAIRKALEKLPADRFAHPLEFAKALDDPAFRYGASTASPEAGRRRSWQSAALVGIGVVLGTAAVTLWPSATPDVGLGVTRFSIAPSEEAPMTFDGLFPDLAISRDGRQIVHRGDGSQLNLRFMDQLTGAPLRGGTDAAGPFFSPDGAWIGFEDVGGPNGRILKKVSALGGPPVTLTESPSTIVGATWGPGDEIVFGTSSGGLFRVSGGGGDSEAVTTLDAEAGELRHLWPSFIDGRRAVVFVAHGVGDLADGALSVVDLETGRVKRLGVTGTSPRHVPTGHLVYAAQDGSLRAVPFDAASLEVAGSPVPLVEGVMVKASGAANFGVSDDGSLVFMPGTAVGLLGSLPWQLVWVDRQGSVEPLPIAPQPFAYPRVSPDGRRLAVSVDRGAARDLWVFDVTSGAGLRLTRDDERNQVPMWTPDGEDILFSSTKDAPRPQGHSGTWWGNIYRVPADGSSRAERVTTSDESQALTGITPDGTTMTYSRVASEHWEVMGTATDGSGDATPLVDGPFRQGTGDISPDGRWLAYRSDETGPFEIYVQPFPGPGAKVPVSIGGAVGPVWSFDSREIFYTDPEGTMRAATISGEGTPRVTQRTALFPASAFQSGGTSVREFHVAPDGRFLMMRPFVGDSDDGGPPTPQIVVVLNWFEELRARVPN